MKIKIFDIVNILAFEKKWASFQKKTIKITRIKVESHQLIMFYEEIESNQELKILTGSKTTLEKKVNNLLEAKEIDCIDISMKKPNSFVAILVLKGEEE